MVICILVTLCLLYFVFGYHLFKITESVGRILDILKRWDDK